MFGVEDVSLITAPEMFPHLQMPQVVLLDGSKWPLIPEQEAALCSFVERGGGLICVGDAAREVGVGRGDAGDNLAAWHAHAAHISQDIA
jgi:hypothetical protein